MAQYSESNFQMDKLTSNNYRTWRTNCELILTAKGLFGYVNGDEEQPPEGAEAKDLRIFKQKQEQAKAVIILTVSDEYKDLVIGEKDAESTWEKLKTTFEPETRVRKSRLRREFLALKLHKGEDMTCFLARVDRAAQSLKEVSVDLTEEEISYQYLDLPSEYDHISAMMYHWSESDFNRIRIKETLVNEFNRLKARK